jgi:hypothetical protein
MARVNTSSFLKSGSRWRPANSPGYETAGKNNFNNKVKFTIDYRDYEKSMNEINKELSSQGQIMKSFYSSIKTQRTGTGNKLFYMELTPQATAAMSGIKNPSAVINAPGEGWKMSTALQPTLAKLGAQGKTIMKKYVNRIETGLMKREVRFEIRKRNGYSTIEIGWIRAWYKYFGFQEDGFNNWRTGTRVPGMRSVMRTGLEFGPKLQRDVTVFLRKYMKAK